MHDIPTKNWALDRVPFLPPNCPWRGHYESIVVPKEQYEFLMRRVLCPTTARYKILLSYLLWGGDRFHDKFLLLPCHLLGNFLGHAESSNLNTGQLLQEFRQDVLAQIQNAVLEIGENDWLESQCRVLKRFHLGVLQVEFDALERINGRLIRAQHMPTGSMVYLHDGLAFSRRAARKLRQEREACFCKNANVAHPVSQKVIDTMARVPASVFARRVTECFAQAAAQVRCIKDRSVRRSQESILRQIDIDPVPRYFHSQRKRSHRVFANGHIPNLKRDIRTVFTSPWPEADLTCAQLAIASVLWKMEKTRSFLADGRNVWEELLSPVHGLSGAHRQEVKSAIKTAMYSMLYLMRESNVRMELQKELLELKCTTLAAEFMAHWIFRELSEASQIQATLLRQGHGLTDAFGEVHYAVNDREPSSVMAQVNQSYELYLLEPVVDYVNAKDAEGNFLVDPKEMRLVIWSHDGFNIAVRRKDQIPRYQRKLSTLVEKRAHQTGIPIKIEWRTVKEEPKQR